MDRDSSDVVETEIQRKSVPLAVRNLTYETRLSSHPTIARSLMPIVLEERPSGGLVHIRHHHSWDVASRIHAPEDAQAVT